MSQNEGPLAELEEERFHLQQQIFQFVEGLQSTWERPVDPELFGEALDALLSEWVASQAQDLGALRDSIHHLRTLLLALDEER
jgi:hypothetical protein